MPGFVDIQKIKLSTNTEVETGAASKVRKLLASKPRLIEILSIYLMLQQWKEY